jgi:hypothetical protein
MKVIKNEKFWKPEMAQSLSEGSHFFVVHFKDTVSTGWCRETGKFEIIRKKLRKLTQLYLILKMCSTRVEISLGITF